MLTVSQDTKCRIVSDNFAVKAGMRCPIIYAELCRTELDGSWNAELFVGYGSSSMGHGTNSANRFEFTLLLCTACTSQRVQCQQDSSYEQTAHDAPCGPHWKRRVTFLASMPCSGRRKMSPEHVSNDDHKTDITRSSSLHAFKLTLWWIKHRAEDRTSVLITSSVASTSSATSPMAASLDGGETWSSTSKSWHPCSLRVLPRSQ